MKRRLLLTLGLLAAALLLTWGTLSVDRCGAWPSNPAQLQQLGRGQGNLKVGAARVELAPRYPTTAGGYPPPRATVERALAPLHARAVVLEAGGQRLALVLLDALFIPPQLRDAIAKGQPFPTWVLATHTHTGPSGFDPRLASELAALGSFSPRDAEVLTAAARQALTEAAARLEPARLEVGEALTEGVSVARSGGEVDRRLTRLRFDGAAGPLAQLVIVAAHPTLVPRRPDGLHPDWPGLLAQRLEQDRGPVTLVLQGAGGNASIDRGALPTPEAAAAQLAAKLEALPTLAVPEPLDAAWTEVHVALPRPDARHVVPGFLRAAAENALCDDAEDIAVLHGLRLGSARLLLVPFEPSAVAGRVLEERAKVARVVSLADGYAGYLEPVEVARLGQGEAHRQYFGPEVITRLAEGATLAGQALE